MQRPLDTARHAGALRRPHTEDLDDAGALHAWRHDDVDELVLEPDDLQLLAYLRVDDAAEAPTI